MWMISFVCYVTIDKLFAGCRPILCADVILLLSSMGPVMACYLCCIMNLAKDGISVSIQLKRNVSLLEDKLQGSLISLLAETPYHGAPN